jgi:hypothetical protein
MLTCFRARVYAYVAQGILLLTLSKAMLTQL